MRRLVVQAFVFMLFRVAAFPSSTASGKGWPFAIRGQLGDADIRAIITVVDHSGRDVAKHIRRIDVKSPTKAEVITFNIPDNAALETNCRFEAAGSLDRRQSAARHVDKTLLTNR